MTHTEIVKKLIGEIKPVGETNADAQRFENLKELCELANDLIVMIFSVANNYKNRPEHSVQKASNYADQFLKETIGLD